MKKKIKNILNLIVNCVVYNCAFESTSTTNNNNFAFAPVPNTPSFYNSFHSSNQSNASNNTIQNMGMNMRASQSQNTSFINPNNGTYSSNTTYNNSILGRAIATELSRYLKGADLNETQQITNEVLRQFSQNNQTMSDNTNSMIHDRSFQKASNVSQNLSANDLRGSADTVHASQDNIASILESVLRTMYNKKHQKSNTQIPSGKSNQKSDPNAIQQAILKGKDSASTSQKTSKIDPTIMEKLCKNIIAYYNKKQMKYQNQSCSFQHGQNILNQTQMQQNIVQNNNPIQQCKILEKIDDVIKEVIINDGSIIKISLLNGCIDYKKQQGQVKSGMFGLQLKTNREPESLSCQGRLIIERDLQDSKIYISYFYGSQTNETLLFKRALEEEMNGDIELNQTKNTATMFKKNTDNSYDSTKSIRSDIKMLNMRNDSQIQLESSDLKNTFSRNRKPIFDADHKHDEHKHTLSTQNTGNVTTRGRVQTTFFDHQSYAQIAQNLQNPQTTRNTNNQIYDYKINRFQHSHTPDNADIDQEQNGVSGVFQHGHSMLNQTHIHQNATQNNNSALQCKIFEKIDEVTKEVAIKAQSIIKISLVNGCIDYKTQQGQIGQGMFGLKLINKDLESLSCQGRLIIEKDSQDSKIYISYLYGSQNNETLLFKRSLEDESSIDNNSNQEKNITTLKKNSENSYDSVESIGSDIKMLSMKNDSNIEGAKGTVTKNRKPIFYDINTSRSQANLTRNRENTAEDQQLNSQISQHSSHNQNSINQNPHYNYRITQYENSRNKDINLGSKYTYDSNPISNYSNKEVDNKHLQLDYTKFPQTVNPNSAIKVDSRDAQGTYLRYEEQKNFYKFPTIHDDNQENTTRLKSLSSHYDQSTKYNHYSSPYQNNSGNDKYNYHLYTHSNNNNLVSKNINQSMQNTNTDQYNTRENKYQSNLNAYNPNVNQHSFTSTQKFDSFIDNRFNKTDYSANNDYNTYKYTTQPNHQSYNDPHNQYSSIISQKKKI